MPLIYKIDVLKALKENGFNTKKIRDEKILSESTLQRLRRNPATINSSSIEIICKFLDCQPGDLLEYTKDEPLDD